MVKPFIFIRFIFIFLSVKLLKQSLANNSFSNKNSVVEEKNYLNCNTLGVTAYVILFFNDNITFNNFWKLFLRYSEITDSCTDKQNQNITSYNIYFGTKWQKSIITDSLTTLVSYWSQDPTVNRDMFNSSIINTSNSNYLDIFQQIEHNLLDQDMPVKLLIQKKDITVLANFNDIKLNSKLEKLNNFPNTESYYMYETDKTNIIFTKRNKVCQLKNTTIDCMDEYCSDEILNLPSKYGIIKSPINPYNIFISFNDIKEKYLLLQLLEIIISSKECKLNNDEIAKSYLEINIHPTIQNKTILRIPWLGNYTKNFVKKCVRNLQSPDTFILQSKDNFYTNVYNNMKNDKKIILIDQDIPYKLLSLLKNTNRSSYNNFNIFINGKQTAKHIYDNFTHPLNQMKLLSQNINSHIYDITNISLINNYSTICTEETTFYLLSDTSPYNFKESWNLAWRQFIFIVFCCTLSVIILSTIFYKKNKKLINSEIAELDEEMKAVTKPLRKAKNLPETERLPWEVKSDRIHIDYEFPLGNGKYSNVYLGKLKGPAPVMGWIKRVEIKQYQDCAVAIKVPKRFDSEEEGQLLREIAVMKAINNHVNICMLLGCTVRNNLVCTVMELTHTNLNKYLKQIKHSFSEQNTNNTSIAMIPYGRFINMIIEICNAMSLLASKGFVHRDLAARNILLTTGLRAKISGLGFCSNANDKTFEMNKKTYKLLHYKTMSIEVLTEGIFSEKSDTWSFGLLLYEIYSMGESPYKDVKREDLVRKLKNGERLRLPIYATDEIYGIMLKCWHKYAERRPGFYDLQNMFLSIYERQFSNPAFVFDAF
ncbi:Putative tyrosine-protein kinase Wsck [Strongyloides ratti]|uniref:Putative tyrosine-protein kinase Wsck n=1 Tax=Strongyloides ratti TaxID=34506 RepID=A0A090KQB4_STRRB|nr:Putative tyrosine-protein kinase Wsck [Strongyloides ratti]CEF59579.1 Putative tyrosine-protein kinase Wsck [Strongyloides ratti]